jgi:hypothetical protein
MAISKLLERLCMLFAAMWLSATSVVQAQVLPILNSFSNRTFNGTVDVSWPVLFDGCTFVTDSIVLRHSYGAVFRNCRFESKTGVLYVADSGDGMILADCEVTGCDGLIMSRIFNPAYRNYITGVTVNSEECSVLDEQETIIDIDGLELAEKVQGKSDGPLFMVMSSDCKDLDDGEVAHLRIRGLEKWMFVGWRTSFPGLRLAVDDDGLGCRVYADNLKSIKETIISAYTEYGLEAAFMIQLVP